MLIQCSKALESLFRSTGWHHFTFSFPLRAEITANSLACFSFLFNQDLFFKNSLVPSMLFSPCIWVSRYSLVWPELVHWQCHGEHWQWVGSRSSVFQGFGLHGERLRAVRPGCWPGERSRAVLSHGRAAAHVSAAPCVESGLAPNPARQRQLFLTQLFLLTPGAFELNAFLVNTDFIQWRTLLW